MATANVSEELSSSKVERYLASVSKDGSNVHSNKETSHQGKSDGLGENEDLSLSTDEINSDSIISDSIHSMTEGKRVDVFADGVINFLKPIIEELDENVNSTRQSQLELRQQIDAITHDLRKVNEASQYPIELEPHIKKLNNIRRRVMLVNNVLQNAQERLNKIHSEAVAESAKREAILDPKPSPSPKPSPASTTSASTSKATSETSTAS